MIYPVRFLAITTSFGVANLYLDYWVYLPEEEAFEYVGNYPSLTPDEDTQTLEVLPGPRDGHCVGQLGQLVQAPFVFSDQHPVVCFIQSVQICCVPLLTGGAGESAGTENARPPPPPAVPVRKHTVP